MKENDMNKTVLTHKPVQAGDYGKRILPKTPKDTNKTENVNTDGRKVLALWSN